ncbi:DNA adenine methylase [Sporolactobacillus sp. KGMB 08714]|uniref:DNA adenine methylase n=1 Tax=Sporolactobacillus sp. KGMB 08714 TaxID=3064704 RepID=UPI002FBE259E
MNSWRSPLRYPGGKLKLAPLIEQLISNNKEIINYVEPFAGGAGIGIYLLLNKKVEHITLNDFDIAIYSFWTTVTSYNAAFLDLFDAIPVTVPEWKSQKEIFSDLERKSKLTPSEIIQLGFSTFFLNRTNFSGILRGATPVGGMNQNGKWKIDYEFNKDRLRPLIAEIGKYADRISVTNLNMVTSMKKLSLMSDEYTVNETLMFIDPPYVKQGKRLYLPIKSMEEHASISKQVSELKPHWVLTYDAVQELMDLYNFSKNRYLYTLQYRVKTHRKGTEFLASSDGLNLGEAPKIHILEKL